MSSADLWAAVAGGANAYLQQRKDDQDEQRWQQRYEAMRKANMEEEKAKQLYLAQIRPPETRNVNTTDTAGKPIIRTEEWRIDGDKGGWQNVGEAPDVNFERLNETARHNQESEQLRSAADQARIEAATARLGLERERLNNAKSGGGGAGKMIRQVMPDGSAVYGMVQDGTFKPVQDEQGNPLSTTAWRPRQGKPGDGDAIGPPPAKVQPVFVDPGANRPLAQFQPKTTAAAPAQPAQGKQQPPPDGTVLYKDGRKYVVRNGVPVPA